MNRKLVAICLSIVMLFNLLIIFTDIAPGATGSVIHVGGAGPGNYSTIQAGINAAIPGDTVFVYSGTYVENVAISKRINLVGEDRFSTVIDGNSITDTVTIAADWVNVSGFTITGGNPFGVFLQANSDNNSIENNIISGNGNSGIEVYWFSHYNTVANNTITGNSLAGVVIHSNCQHNVVADNYIDDNSLWGIIITNPFDDYPNSNNRISDNIINNSDIGVYLYNINSRNIIENNTVNNTEYGISLYLFNDNNTINGNTITNSSVCGMYLLDLNENNIIYHNNFVNNAFPAFDNGTNFWNLSYPWGGNFWDDYSGGDNRSGPLQDIYGNDAFGDEKYGIAGGANEDSYPLWPNWNALEFYEPFPVETDVCEYAIGNVKVAVIFVESNGSIDPESEDWTAPRQSTVLSEIQDALTWWESLEANSSLNLSIEVIGIRNTSYEPISRPSSDDELWIGEIMAEMGFSQGIFLQQVMSFNHWLRGENGTDWAYTIFVVDSFNDADGAFTNAPVCAYSYSTASCIVMTYDNNGYGIAKMNNVTAHETGHMFYATDEYKNPGETSGYLNASEVDDSGCLMDDNTLVLSSGTELQIGWRDTDSDGTMDILDTEPNTYLVPYDPDPTFNTTPTYTGYAVVVPYPNNNPYGFLRDVTLNTISNVQFRIDSGQWMNATAADGDFDEAMETYQFTTPLLSPGIYLIETRAVNSVNNSDPTIANDIITILGDFEPPHIKDTTTDIPVSGDSYNVTVDVTDNVEVDTVWLNYTVTSSDGYSETHNISMNQSTGDSYWNEIGIWSNATWFNYSIAASDTSGNWNTTSTVFFNFKVHNLDTGEGFLEIQAAIDDADTSDGHSIFVDSGIFYENVAVDKSITLTGENANNTIIDAGGAMDVVWITANYVNISGFTITNCGPVWTDSGITIKNAFSCNIYNNSIVGNNVGIYMENCEWCTITNNNLSYNSNRAIDLESSHFTDIHSNTVWSGYDGFQLGSSNGNNITENSICYNGGLGIHLYSCNGSTISDNNISNNAFWGVRLQYSVGNNITDNIVSNNSDGIMVLFSSSENIISNNTILYNNFNGILVSESSNNTIVKNEVSYSDYGISLGLSSDNFFFNNSMIMDGMYIQGNSVEHWNSHTIDTTNTVNGRPVRYWKNQNAGTVPQDAGQVILANCSNIEIIDTKLSNTTVGIELGFSSHINVSGNDLFYNHYGIYLQYSVLSQIIENNISSNYLGFSIKDSSNNSIYHNNIINNANQALDLRGVNFWDNGYPSGGNYWSDYTGNDIYKGPNQDIPGGDGIGDTNYSIDSDSIDNYPLMTPYPIENYMILYEGWNLISIPLIQSEQNLSRVLGSIDGCYDAVQWYNPTDTVDPWKHNKVGKPFGNDLFEINETMGFWVHLTEPGESILLYNGTQPATNQTITLYKGWNVVGYPSITNKTRDIALNNLTFGTEINAIFTFDAATQTWVEVGPTDYFKIGRGYWIHATQECEWEVPL